MSQLCTYFLGPFQLTRSGVSVTGFGSDKMRALLAYLLIERDRPHRRDALAALLWPEQTDSEARHSLRQTLYVLRRILSSAGSAGADRDQHEPDEPDEDDHGPLLVTRQTVQLNLASDAWCDVAVFTQLLAACQAHQHRSGHPDHCAECIERFQQAATLYRGDFLQGFLVTDTEAFEEWLLLERETHHRQMLHALERLADYYEEVGEHEQSLHFALWQLKLEPWREEAHRQAMRLLSRTGQRSTALAQYEACRRTLAAELGLEPARETTALYERIRDAVHEVHLEAPLGGMSFLPAAATPLIGREAEVTEVGERLLRDEVRLLTVTGPGGVGKTRVALQAAAGAQEHFAHGACFVDLAPLTDPGLVAAAIATALGIKEQRVQGVPDSIAAYLGNKQVLLLLDNFEQVGAAAPQVSRLLAACPGLKILVTSRVPLGVRGEREYPVPPLSLPDLRQLPHLGRLAQYEAMRLFVERATDVRPDFRLTAGNARAVAEICVRLDGLPLAIELAAARVRMLPPPLLLARLSRRLSLLTGGARDAPARQQTMRSTIEWSYDLLDSSEQQLFRRMAPFSGGRSLEALEAVCNYDGQLGLDVFDGVGSLLSKNLLRQVEARGREPRFWMLETIHEYAREKLQESGEAEALVGMHARYFAALAEEAAPHLKQEDQASWLEQLEADNDNIRAAFRWAREYGEAGDIEAAETGLRLAISLERFWQVRVYLREGLEQTQGLLAIGQPMGAIRARALMVAGALADVCGDHATARSMHEESIEIWRELGDKRSLIGALNALGLDYYTGGDFEEARALIEEALRIEEELGEGTDSLHNLGLVFYELGDYASAASFLQKDLAIQREIGDTRRAALALANLGLVAFEQGDYELALARHRESLSIRRTLGAKLGFVFSLEGLAMVYRALDRPEVAAHLWGAAHALRDAIGAPVPPNEHTRYRREMELVRTQLGEEEFEKAMQEGRAMSMDEAIEYALEDPNGTNGSRS